MKAGQRWPLGITLHALLISSANDAAYALAERVGGSVGRLRDHHAPGRRPARDVGPPVLHDPAGLDGTEGVGGGNRMSAWDLAIAARDLMANPALAAIVALNDLPVQGPGRDRLRPGQPQPGLSQQLSGRHRRQDRLHRARRACASPRRPYEAGGPCWPSS